MEPASSRRKKINAALAKRGKLLKKERFWTFISIKE